MVRKLSNVCKGHNSNGTGCKRIIKDYDVYCRLHQPWTYSDKIKKSTQLTLTFKKSGK